jgi:hypothetical protein
VTGVIDAILIEDQGLGERGELQQSMPVGVVASKVSVRESRIDIWSGFGLEAG